MTSYTIFKFLLIEKVGAPLGEDHLLPDRDVGHMYTPSTIFVYISKFVVADVSFIIYHDQDNSYAISIFSRYVFSLDVSSVFVLQTALIMIPLSLYHKS